jgi:putative transposase
VALLDRRHHLRPGHAPEEPAPDDPGLTTRTHSSPRPGPAAGNCRTHRQPRHHQPGVDSGSLISHLIRNTFRLASRRDWDALKRDVRPIYTAVSAAAARVALDELTGAWGSKYGAIIRLWENAWEQFIPFLDYDLEIRTVLCSTNAIESLNARYRRAVKARGHFPTEQAALKCLYLVTRSLDPTGTGRTRWAMRWKPALNAFAITFGDRFPSAETY